MQLLNEIISMYQVLTLSMTEASIVPNKEVTSYSDLIESLLFSFELFISGQKRNNTAAMHSLKLFQIFWNFDILHLVLKVLLSTSIAFIYNLWVYCLNDF